MTATNAGPLGPDSHRGTTVKVFGEVVRSMTSMLPLPILATYTLVPDGLTATPWGAPPTATVSVTRLDAVLITFTSPAPLTAT